ncbi:nucleotidyl transferase AbiEii/AbiGii toxin family protein [Flindersiella endophytica]
MSRITRETAAGQAYLDLQNRARRERRGTQELLTLYVVERWLARLSASPYAAQFILKGGVLLAAFGARRPTADADTLARDLANDDATIAARVVEIARVRADDGVEFLPETVATRTIRDQALYAGVRVTMDARIATAAVKFRLDVNFGDPITPAPTLIDLPSLRPGRAVRVLGYPIETVLAEKVTTALTLGAANTRVRDYADLYVLTGRHDITHAAAREALLATAAFRGTRLMPLSSAIDNLVDLRRRTFTAYRTSLGVDGEHLPSSLGDVVSAVTAFADPLVVPAAEDTMWLAANRRWDSGRGTTVRPSPAR